MVSCEPLSTSFTRSSGACKPMAMIYRDQKRLEEAVAALQQVVVLKRLVQHPDLERYVAMLAQVEAELAAQLE